MLPARLAEHDVGMGGDQLGERRTGRDAGIGCKPVGGRQVVVENRPLGRQVRTIDAAEVVPVGELEVEERLLPSPSCRSTTTGSGAVVVERGADVSVSAGGVAVGAATVVVTVDVLSPPHPPKIERASTINTHRPCLTEPIAPGFR